MSMSLRLVKPLPPPALLLPRVREDSIGSNVRLLGRMDSPESRTLPPRGAEDA